MFDDSHAGDTRYIPPPQPVRPSQPARTNDASAALLGTMLDAPLAPLARPDVVKATAPQSAAPTIQRTHPARPAEPTVPRKKEKDRKPDLGEHRVATFDEVASDGMLTLLAACGWAANGFATCLTVQHLFPAPAAMMGFVLGAGLHYFISRIQMAYMTRRRVMSGYLVPLALALLVDVGTTTDGVRLTATMIQPETFASVPNILVQLYQLLSGAATDTWRLSAIAFFILGTVIAIGSERVLRPLWKQFLLSYYSWREGLTILEVKEEWSVG